ncbi:MFS transporter [Planomicrobium sp. CPCC 101110]|uniref:MFS transporter n=1 Tax=Planomicrobium sp. CPCC 101110 TaxID=2599619 RepID=UPI0011B53C39|nr:MFS transporter [Planomicrobium sp. CPCC 101110]TWT24354.1 MFS transporter [Planomicrobium sp. CPCC 101110]
MNAKADQSIQPYIESPEKLKKLYRHVIFVASLSQIFGGAGLAAGITVGALLAQQMLGTAAYAGLPIALFTLGSAGAALLVGQLSQRWGRRPGLTTGFMLGGVGGLGVVLAAILGSIPLLWVSLIIYGSGTATNLQARYAGTDLASKNQRGKAVSIIMVSATAGAFAGPNMVGIMGRFALSIGIPALAGPFLLSGTAFIVAGMIIFLLLRPDPFLIAKAIEAYKQENSQEELLPDTVQAINKKGVAAGAAIMVLTQMTMIAIMTMTPVHMGHYGHDLSDIGLLIGIHIGAMYLPSVFTGILVDKFGSTAMSIASGAILGGASALAAFAPGDSLAALVLALALLGIGWNFGLISGTTQVIDSTDPAQRAKIQGTVDVFIALAGASGGVLSGMVVAGSSYAVLSLIGGLVSLVLIPIILWSRTSSKAQSSNP